MADIYYLIIYVFLTIVEMYLNYKLKKSVENKSEIAELDKLKTKKNKTLEDQLRFMDLNKKHKKYFSISLSTFIKLIFLVLLITLLPKYRIYIILGIFAIRIIRIIYVNIFVKHKKSIFYEILNCFLHYLLLYLFFTCIKKFNFFIIFGILIIVSFIFNFIKNSKEGKNANIKNRKKKDEKVFT